jgi:hypothetical protein
MHVIPLKYMLYLCNTCYTFATSIILLQYMFTFAIHVITLQYTLYFCNAHYTFAMNVIPLQYMLYLCNTCYAFATHVYVYVCVHFQFPNFHKSNTSLPKAKFP